MKRVIFLFLIFNLFALSACEGADVKKNEVMVDTFSVDAMSESLGVMDKGIIKLDDEEREGILSEADRAFQYYLNVPEEERNFIVSIEYKSFDEVKARWERMKDEVFKEFEALYPDSIGRGNYEVVKMDNEKMRQLYGSFEEESTELLSLTNPYWQQDRKNQLLTREEVEQYARAYVIKKSLAGDEEQVALASMHRVTLPDEETELYWLLYKNREEPKEQVMVLMRTDSTQFFSFQRNGQAFLTLNEIQQFAEPVEIE